MNTEEHIKQISADLSTFLFDQIKLAPSNEAKSLLKRIKEVSSTGKRFRPSLFLNIYKAYGGKKELKRLAIAFELIQQALTIHDDLIDQDTKRHGQQNIYGAYIKEFSSSNKAGSMALLAGDLVLTLVTQIILEEDGLSDKQKLQVLSLINKALSEAIYGQQLDALNVNNLSGDMSQSQLLKIYRLKTTSYSTLLPIAVASHLIDIKRTEIKKLDKLAFSLGYLLQLTNDYNDYFNPENGRVLSDFRLGKVTMPYLVAKRHCKPHELRLLNSFSRKSSLTLVQAHRVIQILTRRSVDKYCQDLIDNCYHQSVRELNSLGINETFKLELLALIQSLRV